MCLCEEGTTQTVARILTCKPRPSSGRDCLMGAMFARQLRRGRAALIFIQVLINRFLRNGIYYKHVLLLLL